MQTFASEATGFAARKMALAENARMRAALQLLCGVDLDKALRAEGDERRRLSTTIERRLERERLKGLAGHWAYDLNRHIALKRAVDQLRLPEVANAKGGPKAASGDVREI